MANKTTKTTNGSLQAVEQAFKAYTQAFGSNGQTAYLAYVKGRKSPNAEELKKAFTTTYTAEAQAAWAAYKAARAEFRTATGNKAPVMRFPKAQ